MLPLLPERLSPRPELLARVERDYEALADARPPAPLEAYIREAYGLDLTARLGRWRLRHPFGKASGQLSLATSQVEADAEAGLAFVVLKTVIAENPRGGSRMEAWKLPAARMVCERIRSRSGRDGWTITWVGRGWEGSLAEYARLVRETVAIGRDRGLPVIPSVKLHVPTDEGEEYDAEEYAHTLRVLEEAWREGGQPPPLVIEKDFSPTLAALVPSRARAMILGWLRDVPRVVRSSMPEGAVAIGIKLMNALFDDGFQIEMLRAASEVTPPVEFLTCFNRLFDPEREFEGRRGVAYGGHDLSDRNLDVLERWALEEHPSAAICATGNIGSGRMMAEYALRGASCGQIHTFFQVPRSEYRSRAPRSRAALHELLFHPQGGLIVSLDHIRESSGRRGSELRFLDLPLLGREILEARHG